MSLNCPLGKTRREVPGHITGLFLPAACWPSPCPGPSPSSVFSPLLQCPPHSFIFKQLLLGLSLQFPSPLACRYSHPHLADRHAPAPSSGQEPTQPLKGSWERGGSNRAVSTCPRAAFLCTKVYVLIRLIEFQMSCSSLRPTVKCIQTFQVRGSLAIVYLPWCFNSYYNIAIFWSLSLLHTTLKLLYMISIGVLVKDKILYMASHNLSFRLGQRDRMDYTGSTGVEQDE